MTTATSPLLPFSVLDNTFTMVGETASCAYEHVIARAKRADELGYRRFWLSEHHAMPAAATPAPQLMVARLIAETSRIKLGAGGIMLPNHVPFMVAEQFLMLNALAPGRIDLGLGRAPGTDQLTAAALRRPEAANDSFPQQVQQLLGFLAEDFPEHSLFSQVHPIPGKWQAHENEVAPTPESPMPWILGSSSYSARLAAALGLPYAFALQFGDADVAAAFALYRSQYVPSPAYPQPYTLISVPVIAAKDADQAQQAALPGANAMARMLTGQSFKLLPSSRISKAELTGQYRQIVESYLEQTVTGTAEQVLAYLANLQKRTRADELMLVTGGNATAQLTTIELVAQEYFRQQH